MTEPLSEGLTEEELKEIHDAGRLWQPESYSPDDIVSAEMARADTAEKQAAAMRAALEHCRQRPHEHNPLPTWEGPTHCEVIDAALASDAGKDWVPRAELGKAVAAANTLAAIVRRLHCEYADACSSEDCQYCTRREQIMAALAVGPAEGVV